MSNTNELTINYRPTKFDLWFEENKTNEELVDDYETYREEARYTGERALTYRQWCKAIFN